MSDDAYVQEINREQKKVNIQFLSLTRAQIASNTTINGTRRS